MTSHTFAIYPIVLAGGSGTRLWPLSRERYPKQFLPLVTPDSTMLQDTLARLRLIEAAAPPIIICNELHRFTVADQLRESSVAPTSVMVEPAGRNTAPALTLGALRAMDASGCDPILLVTHSDHLMSRPHRFVEASKTGLALAEEGDLVAFGVAPTAPETGFGYIRRGEAISSVDGEAYHIRTFVEKPEREAAMRFCQSGDYYWNSGIFMMRASVWLMQVERRRPAIAAAVQESYARGGERFEYFQPHTETFLRCPSDSIDYAVMEGAGEAGKDGEPAARYAVATLDAGWSDVGSWSTLRDRGTQDSRGNVVQGDALVESTNNSLIIGQHRLVAAVGLDDVIVVETADAVLVANADSVQEVKGVVERLRAQGRPEAVEHRRTHRPWGSFDVLDSGAGFQVKRLTVSPGASVSLQFHHHRSEHWIVVRGTARVTKGDETFLLNENESVAIPRGAKHRLENPGATPLEVIEVQSGDYLGEDDIIRLEDIYHRETSEDSAGQEGVEGG